MKTRTLLAAAFLTLPVLASAQVGVSISIGEPGFYGHIDIGDYPAPRLIYAEPLIVERVRVRPAPMYLRVPPGHARHWNQHCHEYGACARPVYFVQDDWYQQVYAPRYRERHGRRDQHRDNDHHDNDQGHDRGHDKGKGKGHDKH
ncbi:MAG: hypothetical protein Q8Q73_16970 [Stagnimonas sp.]|nr:hypothetical protein [Stagnimonas sp.]